MEDQLRNISNKCYPELEVEEFLSQHSLEILIPRLLEQDGFFGQLINFFQFLIKHEKFYRLVLFAEKELVQSLLESVDPEIRGIISTCIKHNKNDIGPLLIASPLIEQYINVLFYLLNDDVTEIALNTQNFFYYLSKSYPQFYQSESVKDYLKQGIQNQDELQMRYFDILVEAVNINESLFSIYKTEIDFLISLYNTEDVLTQLNALQLLGHYASTKKNSEYLKSQPIFEKILEDCFQKQGELLKKSLILVLIGKMIGNQTIKLDYKLKNLFLQNIKIGFNSKNNDEVGNTLEIIGFLCLLKEGILLVASDKEIFQIYLETSYSLNPTVKLKFLQSLRGLFQYNEFKNQEDLQQVYYCLGNKRFASQLNLAQVEKKIPEDDGQSLQRLLTFAFTPVEQQEKEILAILLQLCDYSFGIKEILKSERIPDYLGRDYARDKEIFDLKHDLLEKIRINTPKFEKKDSVLKTFEERLREALNSKVAQVKYAMEAK